MKKFITVVPLQKAGQLRPYVYQPVDNEKLGSGRPSRFPILSAVRGYVRPGEAFRVLAVLPDSDDCRQNLSLLDEELAKRAGNAASPVPAQRRSRSRWTNGSGPTSPPSRSSST